MCAIIENEIEAREKEREKVFALVAMHKKKSPVCQMGLIPSLVFLCLACRKPIYQAYLVVPPSKQSTTKDFFGFVRLFLSRQQFGYCLQPEISISNFPRAMGKRSDLGKLMVFPPLARGPKKEFRLALCHRGTPDFGREGKVASLLVFYLCLLESFRKVFVSLEARKWQSCTVGA